MQYIIRQILELQKHVNNNGLSDAKKLAMIKTRMDKINLVLNDKLSSLLVETL
jgi:hypothetical protein